MRVLLTGASGMLGQDVLVRAAARDVEVVALTHAEVDIVDARASAEAVAACAPDVIINCAAWTDVNGAEANEPAALALNGTGAGNLARSARDAGARMIHVSTDYVFDGTATRPYVESDPTGPVSAYGRTKLAGEREVLAASPRHAVVRTAWLFGIGRGSFVTFVLERARAGEPIPAFTDQFGCPTYTGHLAEKLLDIARDGACGLLHEVAAGHCSRFELAHAILEAAGLGGTVQAVSRVGQGANRPAWSVLASERDGEPLPPWPDGLDAYLAQMRAAA